MRVRRSRSGFRWDGATRIPLNFLRLRSAQLFLSFSSKRRVLRQGCGAQLVQLVGNILEQTDALSGDPPASPQAERSGAANPGLA